MGLRNGAAFSVGGPMADQPLVVGPRLWFLSGAAGQRCSSHRSCVEIAVFEGGWNELDEMEVLRRGFFLSLSLVSQQTRIAN